MLTRNRFFFALGAIVAAVIILAVVIFRGGASPIEPVPDEIRNDPSYPVQILDVTDIQDDVVIEEDVGIIVRDGTRLAARVFRPAETGTYPVIMSFTAYNKDNGPDLYPPVLNHSVKPEFNLGTFEVSPWTTWEGPDPAFWVPEGYVVIYVDARGYYSSEGDPGISSPQDGLDFYDAIEWAGGMEWSNGNVGLTGVSYLAISQWVAASANPPSLKAIIPWEGQNDSYREVIYHGGIPETAFTTFWQGRVRQGASSSPLPPQPIFRFAHKRPEILKRVQANSPSGIDLEAITVPALICGSWSDHGLHTRGSFEGYKQISSEQKWIFTHGRPKWDVYYSDEALAAQKQFFDHFLKGIDNGMQDVGSVRLEIRESLNEYQVRYEESWPIPRTEYRELYLDGSTNSLQESLPSQSATTTYDSKTGNATFTITFEEDTELSGNMKLKLWVSTTRGSDMDLFVGVKKLDTAGEEVHFYAKTGYNEGPVALGWLRVSQRALDVEKSTPYQPVLSHEAPQRLSRNEIVPVEIEILPSSTLFKAGESLQVVIQGTDLFEHPSLGHNYAVNRGMHSIYAGGEYDSHLLIPVIPEK